MMACEIGKIPGHRSVRLPDCIGTVDQRDIIEFRTADPLWLHNPEQTGLMQIPFGLRRKTPQLLGPGSTIAQLWNERFGTCNHGGVGTVVRVRPRGRACARFSTNTCHSIFSLSPPVTKRSGRARSREAANPALLNATKKQLDR